jgi:hypothetical protein
MIFLLTFSLFLLACILYIFLSPLPQKHQYVEDFYEKQRRQRWEEREQRALQSLASKKETALKKEREQAKREAHAERTKRNTLRREEACLEYSLKKWGHPPYPDLLLKPK